MSRIRHIAIRNFRCLKEFDWLPVPGINCLVGPGDCGKSTVLAAIDLCLGARRYVTFSDADFFGLDVSQPISISITIGDLDDSLKSMETYGHYLRSFDVVTGQIEDEPEREAETVLTLKLAVGSDLEGVWSLVSDRAPTEGPGRSLIWSDRVRLSPTRIGAFAENELAWRRGSVLTKLSDEKAETSGALAEAARAARAAFGDLAGEQLSETLGIVSATARELGIEIGGDPKALLDAHSVSFGGGTISLHTSDGVPFRGLGTGSTRLLVAGLQRRAAKQYGVITIDEVEYGLEPHRIIRLLHSIGSKERPSPLQAFLSTHSPVVVRELSADQLTVLRPTKIRHDVRRVSRQHDVQGVLRTYPEAFLASSVIVGEGASEVGLVRGIDQHRASRGEVSLGALGVALVDAGGCDKIYKPAPGFLALGYRTAVFRDDDKQPDAGDESAFLESGGALMKWRPGRALEDELFTCFPAKVITDILQLAIDHHGEELIDEHIRSVSNGEVCLADCLEKLSQEHRAILVKACTTKRAWFKSISMMEHIGREIIGPAFDGICDPHFGEIIESIFTWAANGKARD